MIVVDASAVVLALCIDDEVGGAARARLSGELLSAPELVDIEVVSVLRRGRRARRLDDHRCLQALADLRDLDLHRVPHLKLLDRVWELRDALSAYDAAYVALAEHLAAPLVTADRKLARARGLRCEVELLP